MIKRILILLLILISSQAYAKIGDNTNFWIISQNEYNERISQGKDVILRRYIVIPSIDKNYKDILQTKDEKALLAKFVFMLQKNIITWIEKYIKNSDNSLDINNLIKGLYCISKNQYSRALVHLEKLENNEFKFLKLLLIADCKYESLQDKINFKSVIEHYQRAMDSTDNDLNKSIVNKRIKSIKYQ